MKTQNPNPRYCAIQATAEPAVITAWEQAKHADLRQSADEYQRTKFIVDHWMPIFMATMFAILIGFIVTIFSFAGENPHMLNKIALRGFLIFGGLGVTLGVITDRIRRSCERRHSAADETLREFEDMVADFTPSVPQQDACASRDFPCGFAEDLQVIFSARPLRCCDSELLAGHQSSCHRQVVQHLTTLLE